MYWECSGMCSSYVHVLACIIVRTTGNVICNENEEKFKDAQKIKVTSGVKTQYSLIYLISLVISIPKSLVQ